MKSCSIILQNFKNKMTTTKEIGKWKGGKPGGGISKQKDRGYEVCFSKHSSKFFSTYRYETLEKAHEEAKKYQIKISLELGLHKNQYRHVKENGKEYIEVKLQRELTAKIDIENLPLLDIATWSAHKVAARKEDKYYMAGKINKKYKEFLYLFFHLILL